MNLKQSMQLVGQNLTNCLCPQKIHYIIYVVFLLTCSTAIGEIFVEFGEEASSVGEPSGTVEVGVKLGQASTQIITVDYIE